jgi:hypothetical protein
MVVVMAVDQQSNIDQTMFDLSHHIRRRRQHNDERAIMMMTLVMVMTIEKQISSLITCEKFVQNLHQLWTTRRVIIAANIRGMVMCCILVDLVFASNAGCRWKFGS